MSFRIALSCFVLLCAQCFGQDREVWTDSQLSGSPDPPLPFTLVPAYSKLSFTNPVLITSLDGRLYVLEQKGKLYSFNESDSLVSEPDLVIDLKESFGATAAYGFTYDPNYQDNHFVYLTFIDGPNLENGTRVARFVLEDGKIDPQTEVEIIRWRSGGHNGGCLKFGPDGMLYISTGDAAPPSPPDGNNRQSL